MNRYYDVITFSKYLLSEADRQKLRDERDEYEYIRKKCNELGFEYVVVRQPQQRICFGSSIKRDCLPTKFPYMSPFMGRVVSHPNRHLAPTTYFKTKRYRPPTAKRDWYAYSESVQKTTVQTKGFGGLALRSPRFKGPKRVVLDIVAYDIYKSSLKPDFKPFGVSIQEGKKIKFVNPGVGNYTVKKQNNVDVKCHGKMKRIAAVKTICTPTNLDRCAVCDCTPEVDFWKHFKLKKSLCRACMSSEIRYAQFNSKTKSAKINKLTELHNYDRVRHCGYVHRHDGTKFAIKTLTQHELKIKFNTENYLEKFNFIYF